MAGRAQMQSVELDEPDEAPTTPGTAARWRPSRRWLALPVGLVLVLLAAQAVEVARERAALAELASVPGVVPPVDQDLQVLWTAEPGTEPALWSGLATTRTLVGHERRNDGSQALVALDRLTGERRWTAPLAPAHEVLSGPDTGIPVGGCARVPEVADRVLCLVSDTVLDAGQTAVTVLGGEPGRLVVVDIDDGAVVADHPAPGAVGFTALPGLAVVVLPAEDGGVVVRASGLLDGQELWRTTLPALPVTSEDVGFADGHTAIFALADGFGVVQSPGRMTLLDDEGVVVRSDIDARRGYETDPATGTAAAMAFAPDDGQRTTVVGRGPAVVLPGNRVHLAVDDGSVPGLLLMSDSEVHAYERGSTAPRWSVDGSARSAIVLQGRVYLSTQTTVVAVDARTGEELWRTAALPGRDLGALVTDGRHLLSGQQRTAVDGSLGDDVQQPGDGELVAYRLEDGMEVWRTDLPEGVFGVTSTGPTLVGHGVGTTVVLG